MHFFYHHNIITKYNNFINNLIIIINNIKVLCIITKEAYTQAPKLTWRANLWPQSISRCSLSIIISVLKTTHC